MNELSESRLSPDPLKNKLLEDQAIQEAIASYGQDYFNQWNLAANNPPPHAKDSLLDMAVRVVLDARKLTGDGLGQEYVTYSKNFIKTVPLFMKGRLAFGGLVLSCMADEVRKGDDLYGQSVDAVLGLAKALVLRRTFESFSRLGLTPGGSGVVWTE